MQISTQTEVTSSKKFFIGKFSGRREHQTQGTYWLLSWMLKLARLDVPFALHKVAVDAISQLGDMPIESEVNWGKVKKSGQQDATDKSNYSFTAAEATRWARKAQQLWKSQKETGVTIDSIKLAKEDISWWEAQHSQFSTTLAGQGFEIVLPEEKK